MAPPPEASVTARKSRWESFLRMDRQRRFLHLISCTDELPERPWPTRANKRARIEWGWRKYLRQLEQLAWLDHDAIPCLEVYTGTEIFAEAFGCRVVNPSNDMPFARPLIDRASQVAGLKAPDISYSSLSILFEIADELRRRAGNGAPVRMVDVQSPMDIAALIWDKNSFFPAVLEAPEAVQELSEKVMRVLTQFLDEWFRRYGVSFVAHCPDNFMPRGLSLSEDEIGSVSPALFETYFLPELVALSRRYGGLSVHCCANARHQWPGIAKIPDLLMLNLGQPVEVLSEAHSYFARVCPQMHGWPQEWDLARGPEQFPSGAHIVITSTVKTRNEAIARAEAFRRHLG